MRQSNLYIVLYSAAITIVCGGLLAFAATSLKDAQDANIAMEQKKNILASVMELTDETDIVAEYNKVKSFVIDYEGNVVPGKTVEQVIVAVEYKKPSKERLLPVYEFRSAADPNKIEYAVLPVYGYGLWNTIWGFVAVRSDFNTIQGIKFAAPGETPGLGKRVEEDEIQTRFKGKTIFEKGVLVSVKFQKGEGNDWSKDNHKVDGLSSATLTAKGVNNMLDDYLTCYLNYLKKNSSGTAINQ